MLSLILLLALVTGVAALCVRAVRRALTVLGVLFLVYWVVLPVTMAIVATRGPGSVATELDLGPRTKQVKIQTADGLMLSVSYVPPRNGDAVITYPSALLTGNAPPPALDDLASEIATRALILINGAAGTGGEELNTDYFAAACEPKEL